jgi:hypothetical protein
MTDRDLLALDKIGFIPGPQENELDFLARVEKTKEKFNQGSWIPDAHWDWTREYLHQLFHVKPLYICAFYSNNRLPVWQGAAAWIDGSALDSIQLRVGLRKGSYLKIYKREEILAHEAVHAARCAFQESQFEEFFAYMTSENKFRRVLGPILRHPWEAWPFMICALGGVIWSGLYLGASVLIGVGFFRLIKRHLILKRASQHVFKVTGDAALTRAILFRLTDEEIKRFARGESIDQYAEKQQCLRWRVILNYLKGDLWQKK